MYYISWPDMHWFTLITVNLLQFIMSDMKGEAIYEDQVTYSLNTVLKIFNKNINNL